MAVAQRMDLKQGVSQERVKTLSAKGRPIDDEKEAEVIISPILPRINSPADMKSLNENQLILLAQEIREEIIRTAGGPLHRAAPPLCRHSVADGVDRESAEMAADSGL